MPPLLDPTWLALIPAAFFVGSIPFSWLIGLARGVDIRTIGSRNVGATNLGRALGPRYFALGFTLDMLKGLAPVLAAGLLMRVAGSFEIPPRDAWPWLAVMASPVLGHMFSPWVAFKGGKGVATGLGAVMGLFPALTLPGAGALLVFLLVFALWRYVSAASIAAALSLPLWTYLAFSFAQRLHAARAMASLAPQTDAAADAVRAQSAAAFHPLPFVLVASALALLVVYKHRANVSRLLAGTEPAVGRPAPPA